MIKVAEIIEEHKKGNVSKATMIKMAAFKAELEKRANIFDYVHGIVKDPAFQKGARGALGASLALAGMQGVGSLIHMGIMAMEHAYDKYKFDAALEPAFQKVLESHPEFSETPDKEALARRYFEALNHFSPSMAASPIAAGAYIHQAMEYHHVAGGPLPEMVEKATLIQKNLADIHDKEKSEYTTPLGAVVFGLKPQAGKAYGDFKMPNINDMEAAAAAARTTTSVPLPVYTQTPSM